MIVEGFGWEKKEGWAENKVMGELFKIECEFMFRGLRCAKIDTIELVMIGRN